MLNTSFTIGISAECLSSARKLGQGAEYAWPQECAIEVIRGLSEKECSIFGFDIWKVYDEELVWFAAVSFDKLDNAGYLAIVNGFRDQAINFIKNFNEVGEFFFSLSFAEKSRAEEIMKVTLR